MTRDSNACVCRIGSSIIKPMVLEFFFYIENVRVCERNTDRSRTKMSRGTENKSMCGLHPLAVLG